MGANPSAAAGPVPLRRRLKSLRRAAVYYTTFGPLLFALERAPRGLIRLGLRYVLEPLAHLGTRRLSQRHLERVYGEAMPAAERARIARAVTRNFVAGVEDFLDTLRGGVDAVDDRLDDRAGRAMVQRLEAESPRGFIAVTGHIGNWELLGSWIARRSSRGLGAAIANRLTNRLLNARVERLRGRIGLQTLYRDDPPTRTIRLLRDGRVVAVVPDQDIKSLSGLFVDFLGHRAYTPLGPARLALAANVPLVCGFFVRNGDGSCRIDVSEPIYPDRDADRAEEMLRLTQAWSAEVEKAIRKDPGQWVWFHERWRTTPEKLAARGRRELEV